MTVEDIIIKSDTDCSRSTSGSSKFRWAYALCSIRKRKDTEKGVRYLRLGSSRMPTAHQLHSGENKQEQIIMMTRILYVLSGERINTGSIGEKNNEE